MTDTAASDTTVGNVHGITTRQSSADSLAEPVADARAVKSRLFGDEEGDQLHKQLLKARLLRDLQQPTGGLDTHEEAEGATEPIHLSMGQLPDSPVRLGRYAVLRKLGQGGMGVVYVAFDEDLDRKIAIKLLRGELSKDDRGRTRMLREAQALARLSHPNVVQVHEIGQWSDYDYVAMEYVHGHTLDRWLAERPRNWREVLDVLIQAGRGLEAAHAADLVHRDFKPANLLIGGDGRARVLDFGLARACNEGETLVAMSPSDADTTGEHDTSDATDTSHDLASNPLTNTASSSAFDKLLTVTGAVLGTPAYMAPEQHLGQLASTLSDQFSFCVVLYEALYGQRPFKGGSRTEYALHVAEGKFEPPPANAGVPLWLRKVVMRGLASRPEDRWPSMTVLLAELGRNRTQTWRGAVVAAGLLLAFGVSLSISGDDPKLCERDPGAVADTWGADQHEAVRVAFAKIDMREAADVLTHTVRSLDDYATQLVDARAQACDARWVARSQTDAQLELRHACLEQRERELAAVVEVLADADREVVLHSPELIAGLGDVGLCARVDLLEAGTPAPKNAEAVERIAEVRGVIAEARAAWNVGRIEEAKALTESAWRNAEQLGFEPLLGELHNVEGRMAWVERDRAKAWRHLVDAAVAAQQTEDHELWAQSQINLALLVSDSNVNPDERLEFMLAAAAVERLGKPERHIATLSLARGLAWIASGKPELALKEFDLGLEVAKAGFIGSEHVISEILVARSGAHASLGHLDEARKDLEQVVSTTGIRTRIQTDALFDLAVVELESGDMDDAERDIKAAMRGYEALFGPDYDSIGHGHLALADIALRRLDVEAATRSVEAALQILDEDHEDHHWVLDGLVSIQIQRKDFLAADQTLRRAIAQFQRVNPADVARLAYFHGRLGIVFHEREQLDAAIGEFDRAIALLEQQQIDAPLILATVLFERGEARLDQGQPLLALSSLERAVELATVECGDAWLAGQARLAMAESLGQLDVRHDEKRALARLAFELLAGFPENAEESRRARELSELPNHENEVDERNTR